MSTVRVNVTLPEDIARKLDSLVEPKKKSRFVAEAVKKKIEDLQRERTEALLKEGYKDMHNESLAIARDFEAADIEGWDEY
jgi:metal-responsive CopG/Arc/MetJ family transcriptional regulator